MSQHYDEFMADAIKHSCNKEIAHLYLVSDLKSGELIEQAIKQNIPRQEIVQSISYFFDQTLDSADDIVARKIIEILESDMNKNLNTITV